MESVEQAGGIGVYYPQEAASCPMHFKPMGEMEGQGAGNWKGKGGTPLDKVQSNGKRYEYDAVLESSEAGKGGAYVRFPYDIRSEFGRGSIKVQASFDGEPYRGSIVNMGVKNPDGSTCYIIGVLKAIRAKLGKQVGDSVHVVIEWVEG